MRKRIYSIFLFIFFFGTSSYSQQKWDLRRAVDYALTNNISVKQADLQVRFSELNLKQSRLSQWPAANFSGNTGYSAGRNQDPTNFSLITTAYWFSNYQLQAGLDLFNWFSKRNTVISNSYDFQASQAQVDKVKNDIALNVAVAYLQILLAKEQVGLAKLQVAQTESQLESTRKQVDAGKLPELNAAQIESQLATDSSNLISAEATVQQLTLQLKALLNLDAALPFDVDTPPVASIPVENLSDLQPETVYASAIVNLPQQKVNELRLQAAKKSVEATRGSMYPTLSLFGNLGTAYNNRGQQIISSTKISPAIGNVTVGGTPYQVFPVQPFDQFTYGNIPYFNQLNQNLRRSIGLSLSVPILNGGILRTALDRSKLTVRQWELTKEQDNQTLKQDIYKAYNDALTAIEKFNASKKSVQTATRALSFSQKRYDLGLLSVYDLINSRNTLLRASIDMLYNQYDYVFKIKLLEFYKGQGLKL
jgi:outer membrane protein